MDSLTSTASNEYSDPIVDKDVYVVDPFLVEALQNPRHRLTFLRMEQNIQQFLQNAHAQQFEFQYLPSSYLRLAAHRVSQHYGLQTLVQDNALDGQGTKIIVRKLTESRYPAMHLSEIPIKQLGNEKNENVKIVLMQKSCNASSNEGGQSGIKCNNVKTVEERMEDYDRARARIFSSHVPNSSELEDTMCQAAEEGNPSCMADPERSFSIKDAAGLPSRVAIFKDREKDLTDPDYDRSYKSLFLVQETREKEREVKKILFEYLPPALSVLLSMLCSQGGVEKTQFHNQSYSSYFDPERRD